MAKYNSPFLGKCTQTCAFKVAGNWRAGYHTGEDWVCDNRQLVSPCDGTVSYVGYDENGYGNYIIIHTSDGRAILMGHFASTPTVSEGQTVKSGTKVGTMGSTGNSTGPHLHIEVQSVADWNYGENLLKPSDYIAFNGSVTGGSPKSVTGGISRSYQNGSTKERTYHTTSDALNDNNSIGYLDEYQSAYVVGRFNACPVVVYDAQGDTKVGFVCYEGGVTEQNYNYKTWKNGSTDEQVYATVEDCKAGANAVGTVYAYESADCCGKCDGCYIIVYDTDNSGKKVGFVKYSGGVS